MICSPERLRIAGRKVLEIAAQNSVGPIKGIEYLTDAELFGMIARMMGSPPVSDADEDLKS